MSVVLFWNVGECWLVQVRGSWQGGCYVATRGKNIKCYKWFRICARIQCSNTYMSRSYIAAKQPIFYRALFDFKLSFPQPIGAQSGDKLRFVWVLEDGVSNRQGRCDTETADIHCPFKVCSIKALLIARSILRYLTSCFLHSQRVVFCKLSLCSFAWQMFINSHAASDVLHVISLTNVSAGCSFRFTNVSSPQGEYNW